ncbi:MULTISPECIES: class I SAM-dependent methyltransferase [Microbulbifer]|nr:MULTISPECIES: class I SAM-dependent methyltransferase [Microbulbifer]
MRKNNRTRSGLTSDTESPTNPWDTYWKGTRQSSTYKEGETESHVLTRQWREGFEGLEYQAVRMLDIASGYGIVAQMATSAFGDRPHEITCIDISEAALDAIKGKIPSVKTQACDASKLPFEDSSFNLITSQFGIEYAGEKAFLEACRVLEPEGTLMVIAHLAGGGIHKECEANYAAIKQFRESQFIDRSLDLLETKMKRGSPQEDIDLAFECAKPSIKTTADLIKKYGRGIAGGTLDKIFTDVARISRNSQNYDPKEVLGWLDLMRIELEAYSGRMESMCRAAIDDCQAAKLESALSGSGIQLKRFVKLPFADSGENCAWLILGKKVA